jgi:hypothetical protein
MLFLGNSPAHEFYIPTFRNTLFHLHRQVGVKNELSLRNVGIYTGKRLAQAIFEPNLYTYNTSTFLKTSSFYTHLPAYEDGTDRVFRNVGI